MESKYRKADARWRSNISICYDTLKFVVPEDKKSKRKVSKTAILQETAEHIQFLEDILVRLFEEKGKKLEDTGTSDSVDSLEKLRLEFIEHCSYRNKPKQRRSQHKQNKTPLCSPDNMFQNSSHQFTKLATPSSPHTDFSDVEQIPFFTMLLDNTPDPSSENDPNSQDNVPVDIGPLFSTPTKAKKHPKSNPSTPHFTADDFFYLSPDCFVNHPAFLTPTKNSRQIGKSKKIAPTLVSDAASPHSSESAKEPDNKELFCSETNQSLDDLKILPNNPPKRRKYRRRDTKRKKPACCRQLESEYISDDGFSCREELVISTDSQVPSNNDLILEDNNDNETKIMKSLSQIWHSDVTPEKYPIDVLTSLELNDCGEVTDRWESAPSDTAIVPESVIIPVSPTSLEAPHVVPQETACDSHYHVLTQPCFAYNCFSDVLSAFNEP